MSIKVVKTTQEGSNLVVIVEGDNFSDVSSASAKSEAVKAASKELGICGINNISGPYPVNNDGDEVKDISVFAAMAKAAAVAASPACRYRNDFTITRSIG